MSNRGFMVITSHVAASSIIIKYIPNKILALVLIVVSHFLLDAIPHVQPPTEAGYRPRKETFWYIAADIVFAVGMIFVFSAKINLYFLLLSGIISMLPDIFDTTRYFKKKPKIFERYYDFHDKIQNETTGIIGYLTQIVIILLALGLYL